MKIFNLSNIACQYEAHELVGEWISKNEKHYCSNCKKMAIYVPSLYGPSALLTDFCPNCGASMRKEGEAQ